MVSEKRFGFLFVLPVALAGITCGGCAKLRHLEQLLCLRDYDKGQREISAFVERRDKLFERLLADLDAGRPAPGTREEEVIARYGPPLLERKVDDDTLAKKYLLYRRTLGYKGDVFVYLYFSDDGILGRISRQRSDDGKGKEKAQKQDGPEAI